MAYRSLSTTNDDDDDNLSTFLDAEQSQNTKEIAAAKNAAITQLQDPEPVAASTLYSEIVAESTPHPLRDQCALFRQICEADGPFSNTLLQDLCTELQRGQAELQSLMTMIEAEEDLIECLALNGLVDSTMAIYHRQVELFREAPPVERSQQTAADQGEQRELMDLLGHGSSSEGQAVSVQPPQELAKSKSIQVFEYFFFHHLRYLCF